MRTPAFVIVAAIIMAVILLAIFAPAMLDSNTAPRDKTGAPNSTDDKAGVTA